MAATHLGLQYLPVCPRVLCLALFSSWPTQLTCRTAWQFPQAATSLQTTLPWQPLARHPQNAKATCRGRSMQHPRGFQNHEWKLAVNVDKTVSMEFTRRPFSSDFAINLNGNTLKKVRIPYKNISAWSLLQTCGGQPTSTRCSPKRPGSCTPWNDSVVLSLKRLSLNTIVCTSALW